VQWHPERDLSEYAARWRWLYADRSELEQAERLFDRLIQRRTSPLLVDLGDDDPQVELGKLRRRVDDRVPVAPKDDYFLAAEGGQHFLGIMLWRQGEGLGTVGDHEMLRLVQRVVERAKPTQFHPRMQVEYTGPVAMSIDEHNAIRDDLARATGICTTLVLLVIWLYFRRAALLLILGAPVALGLVLALALARMSIHYLNANTAFLISIIVGNGINSPIVLMARYAEERRRNNSSLSHDRGDDRHHARHGDGDGGGGRRVWLSARHQLPWLLQFGLVGGAGMLLVWLATSH